MAKDDLQADANLKRIDNLESFRSEFEGKSFDAKVLASIKDSTHIRQEICNMIWETVRGKLFWVAVTGGSIVLTDLVIRAIPSILKQFGS